ncbi:uncharacterized protein [Triticum aestivum]|uniref:uncharacterized protein n=1 Tax=Triticum aestivum TaxID=4565 RepID=UPI001D0115D5|nr:uncharacterized protein LOC123084149 [Triticum aestivum]
MVARALFSGGGTRWWRAGEQGGGLRCGVRGWFDFGRRRAGANPPRSGRAHLVHGVSAAQPPLTPSNILLSTRFRALEGGRADLGRKRHRAAARSQCRHPTPPQRATDQLIDAYVPPPPASPRWLWQIYCSPCFIQAASGTVGRMEDLAACETMGWLSPSSELLGRGTHKHLDGWRGYHLSSHPLPSLS